MCFGTVEKTTICFMFLRISACIRAAFIGEISMSFNIGDLHEKILRNLSLVKIGNKCEALFIKT
jgi:hypothetical protein